MGGGTSADNQPDHVVNSMASEEQWRRFLKYRTDFRIAAIRTIRDAGGEIALQQLSSVTDGNKKVLSGVIGCLNRSTERLWGFHMIEPKQRVVQDDGSTAYGYYMNPRVPWQIEQGRSVQGPAWPPRGHAGP